MNKFLLILLVLLVLNLNAEEHLAIEITNSSTSPFVVFTHHSKYETDAVSFKPGETKTFCPDDRMTLKVQEGEKIPEYTMKNLPLVFQISDLKNKKLIITD